MMSIEQSYAGSSRSRVRSSGAIAGSRRRDAVDHLGTNVDSPPSGSAVSDCEFWVRFCSFVAACVRTHSPLRSLVARCHRLLQKHHGHYRGRHGVQLVWSGSALTLRYTYYGSSGGTGHVTWRSVYVTQVVKQVSPSQCICTQCPRTVSFSLWIP